MIYVIIGITLGVIIALVINRMEIKLNKKDLGCVIPISIAGLSLLFCITIFLIPQTIMDKYFNYNLGMVVLFTVVTFIAVRQIYAWSKFGKTSIGKKENSVIENNNNKKVE
jgi:hypothetical protein